MADTYSGFVSAILANFLRLSSALIAAIALPISMYPNNSICGFPGLAALFSAIIPFTASQEAISVNSLFLLCSKLS
jgi:hypothetical protein